MAAIYGENILYANRLFRAPSQPTINTNGMGIVNTMFYIIGYDFWHIGQNKLYSDIINLQKAVFQNTILRKFSSNERQCAKNN